MTRTLNQSSTRIWLAGAAVLLLASAAWSNTVRLKRSAVVEADQRVLLSDVADLDGAYASQLRGTMLVARASELLGAQGSGEISLDEVRAMLHREGAVLGRLELAGSACRLRTPDAARPAPKRSTEDDEAPAEHWRTLEDWRTATEQTIEIAIVRRLMAGLDVPAERLRLRFDDTPDELLEAAAADMRTVVVPVTAINSGMVLFRIERYRTNGSLEHRDTVKVEAQVLRTVLKVREQVSRREVIRGGVLEPSEEWLSSAVDAVDGALGLAMVGKIAQTRLEPGKVLLRSQVEEPVAVERNALVELIYHGSGFVLKAKGRTRQAGRVGEIIEVRLEDSRSSVLARVDGPGRVIVVE